MIPLLNKSIQKTSEWLNELDRQLGFNSKQDTYHVLKAVLHAIRDKLSTEEAVHLSAQLPTLIRGVYFENWKPSHKPIKTNHVEDFFELVKLNYTGTQIIILEDVVPQVIKFLSQKISRGEIEDIKSVFPKELSAYWELAEKA